MTVRPVLIWPDKRLIQPATTVDAITDDIHAIWSDMVDVMEAMPGVGLAAVQLGVMQRLAVVDASTERGQAVLMANPELIASGDTLRSHEEASPCLPGVSAVVKRPAPVTVRFLNAEGVVEEREFSGLWATSVQHQIDHLAGKMYFDRLSPMKRRMLLKRATKLRGKDE